MTLRIKKMKKNTYIMLLIISLSALSNTAFSASITNVNLTPDSPAVLPFGEFVNFDFDYAVDVDSRMWGRPFYEGSSTGLYAAHPSPLYLANTSGTDTGFFTINDFGQGVTYVDQIRFQIWDEDQGLPAAEFFVDVDLTFGTVVPVPAAVWLFGSGLLALVGISRRKI